MRAYDKVAIRKKLSHHTRKYLLLQSRCEVGKGEIATKNDIKWNNWRLRSQILMEKCHVLSMLPPHAEARISLVKSLSDQFGRQFTETGRAVAALTRTIENLFIEVGCNHR